MQLKGLLIYVAPYPGLLILIAGLMLIGSAFLRIVPWSAVQLIGGVILGRDVTTAGLVMSLLLVLALIVGL